MKRWLRRLVLAGWGVWGIAGAHATAAIHVDVGAATDRVAIWPYLRVVATQDRQLQPEQAAELAASNNALKVDSPDRVFGRGSKPFWAAFAMHNTGASPQVRLLTLEATTQFDTRLFVRDSSGQWRQLASLAEAAAGRFAGGTTYPVWELHLSADEAIELLLRVEGPAIVRFPLFAYRPAAFAEKERTLHVAIGIALGGCLFIGIYIGSLRRYLEDKSVPLFISMLLADLLGALWLTGFLKELMPGLKEAVLSQVGFGAYATLFGCGILHARIYVNSAAWAPKVDRLMLVAGWAWLGLALWFSLAFPEAARVLTVVGGTAVALMLVIVSLMAARRRVPLSGFIAAAWFAYLVVGSHFLVARVVDDPLLWSPNTVPLAQATVVAFLFGLAMSQRLTRQREILLAARQEAVMLRDKEAAIIRERSLLFAATNHDLRQPLFGVSLYAELLKTAQTQEERITCSSKLTGALREVDDLLVSIQQLATVHESATPPIFETVGLDELLVPLIEEYRGRAEYKYITIRYVPTRLTISTHPPYFQRIVRNLLSNAIRYTDPGDRVLVGCRRGGGVRLIVADTGRGMTEEQMRRAFGAFQSYHAETSIPDGFGLGLFSTKSLANAIGLEIALQSRLGHGTLFMVTLPPTSPLPQQQA